MQTNYILALDQGTTSSRAVIVDHGGAILSEAQKEFRQIYPQPGWVEHDPMEIWSTQAGVIAEVMASCKLTSQHIAAMGITNQRETTVIWERDTGRPIYNAICWQDHRTADFCDQLKKSGLEQRIRDKTGLPIDAYFSATKIHWILQHIPGAQERAERGELAFGTIDSWLIWNLTSHQLHVTDVTNASRTLLFNIHTLTWDEELLSIFSIPRKLLPDVRASSEILGATQTPLLNSSIPIAGVAGDQQAALFGQLCTEVGMAKNTYGTGCFLLMNTGNSPVMSQRQLITTIAWKIKDEVCYCLEGSIFIGGAIVQWLRDALGIVKRASDIERLATSVADSNGVVIVPAFSGLGAPHWNPYARGSIFGVTRGATAAHFARAALEAIAFQSYDVLKAMEADLGQRIAELRVDGGAANNNFLMQFQADLLDATVIRPTITETTALGAAYLAGLAVGFWQSIDELKTQWREDRRFSASINQEVRDQALERWSRAVNGCVAWANA